jgi:hypothetical protein
MFFFKFIDIKWSFKLPRRWKEVVRTFIIASLLGVCSLNFRKNVKKVIKTIPQQLSYNFLFSGKWTVLPDALGSTVHFQFNCLIKKIWPLSSLCIDHISSLLSMHWSHVPLITCLSSPESNKASMAEHWASIFSTEKDWLDHVNCLFYFKIGACRHGDRCSRLHSRPMISPMILLSNMYQWPDTPPRVSTLQNQTTHRLRPPPCQNPPHHHQSTINDKQKPNPNTTPYLTGNYHQNIHTQNKKIKKNPKTVQTRLHLASQTCHHAFTFRRPPVVHDERGESDGDERKRRERREWRAREEEDEDG